MFIFLPKKSYLKIKTIDNLKSIYRKELIFNFIIYSVLVTLCICFAYMAPLQIIPILSILVISQLFIIFNNLNTLRSNKGALIINDGSRIEIGRFTSEEIIYIVDDICIKMNTQKQFDVRILHDEQFQAWTSKAIFRFFLKNKNIIGIHAGLLRILSKHELKAIIAHEVGHHLSPTLTSGLLREYWADFLACKLL